MIEQAAQKFAPPILWSMLLFGQFFQPDAIGFRPPRTDQHDNHHHR